MVVVDVNNLKNDKEASEVTEESPAGCAREGTLREIPVHDDNSGPNGKLLSYR